MTSKARIKGYATVRKGRVILESKGYIVANLEKTGKFVKEKDLFGLWDCLAIRQKELLFIQYKTNLSPGKKKISKWLNPFIEFGKLHGSELVRFEVWISFDRVGFKVIECE